MLDPAMAAEEACKEWKEARKEWKAVSSRVVRARIKMGTGQ